MEICKISGELKIGSNEKGETFVFWPEGNRWLDMEEFAKCEIEAGTKFILKIGTEKVKLNELSNFPNLPIASFNSTTNYSISPSSLKLEDMGLLQNEQQLEPETTPIIPPDPYSISDIFTGIAASTALLMSVVQQVRQKKKEVESSLCCNNNKMEISKFDMKLQKLETEMKANAEKDKKSFFAEVIETQREIKNIKEDFENNKETIQKLIEIIDLQNKNKS